MKVKEIIKEVSETVLKKLGLLNSERKQLLNEVEDLMDQLDDEIELKDGGNMDQVIESIQAAMEALQMALELLQGQSKDEGAEVEAEISETIGEEQAQQSIEEEDAITKSLEELETKEAESEPSVEANAGIETAPESPSTETGDLDAEPSLPESSTEPTAPESGRQVPELQVVLSEIQEKVSQVVQQLSSLDELKQKLSELEEQTKKIGELEERTKVIESSLQELPYPVQTSQTETQAESALVRFIKQTFGR